jgi:cyclase
VLQVLESATANGQRRRPYQPLVDAVEWAHRSAELGAGEILLNSMDADGTMEGYDVEMIASARRYVSVPVIASGGAGKLADFPSAIEAAAGAVLMASAFHFGELRIGQVMEFLGEEAGHPVR